MRIDVDARDGSTIMDLLYEKAAQRQKFGIQHHDDGTGADQTVLDGFTFSELANTFKAVNDRYELVGAAHSWAFILLEEVFEALSETDPDRLTYELIQVMAVAASWIDDVDSRKGA